jgi:hypothetical protein
VVRFIDLEGVLKKNVYYLFVCGGKLREQNYWNPFINIFDELNKNITLY